LAPDFHTIDGLQHRPIGARLLIFEFQLELNNLTSLRNWFARIEREVIARGIFSSTKDLARKLMRYIHAYSAAAKPFSWKYANASRRIHTKELNATAH